FVTTHLIVRTAYLKAHPDVVERLLRGQVAANKLVNSQPAEAQRLVNQGIKQATGKALKPKLISAAWQHLTFTDDPIAASLRTSADTARRLGFLSPDAKIDGIYDLALLNKVLAASGEKAVRA